MKIDTPRGPSAQGIDAGASAKRAADAAAARADAAKRAQPRRDGAPQDGVTVRLSAAATRIDEGSTRPRFDSAKVERIRAALEAGDLPVDSERIAQKMAPTEGND